MLPFPYTHPWSRLQKALIVVATVTSLAAVAVASYSHHQSHRLPDENILFGWWQMIAPDDPQNRTILGLHEETPVFFGDRRAHWHVGAWTRADTSSNIVEGYSDMSWYAGGPYIYMRLLDERQPRIWQIVHIGSEELRLRHADQDYVFRRLRE